MKQIIIILNIFLLSHCFGQNLIGNFSFEDTVNCPLGDVSESVGWINTSEWSPDFFHDCAQGEYNWVPSNIAGHQIASTGKGYCGFATYYPQILNYRETIGRNLPNPMIVGTQYYFSMKVNLAINPVYGNTLGTNNLGVLFSTVQFNQFSPAPINNFAHIFSSQIINDSTNWIIISGSIIADAAYTFLSIGNFFDDINTETLEVTSSPETKWSYYYIDDVCLSSSPTTCEMALGLNNLLLNDKKVVSIVDIMGREVEEKSNTLLIYIYNDGTTKKVIKIE
jgi:hypothetical protein